MGWVLAFLGAIVAHAAWIPLSNWSLSYLGIPIKADVDAVAYLVAGEYKDGFRTSARSFTQHPYAVLSYFASLYVVAGIAGAGLHRLVRRYHWDNRVGLLRFNNQWHYLFSGSPDVSGVLVTVTCQHSDHTCLYAGILESYDFTGAGQLEKIVMISAGRALLTPTPFPNPVFAPIPGDKFIVWFKDINSLNVDYLHTTKPAIAAVPHVPPIPGRGATKSPIQDHDASLAGVPRERTLGYVASP